MSEFPQYPGMPPMQDPTYGSAPVPLSQPLYGASLGQAVARVFKKYATFSGRASLSEYWFWVLFENIVLIGLGLVIGIGGALTMDPSTGEPGMGLALGMVLSMMFMLAAIVPTIAVTVRRLHDANFSGFFYFLVFLPFFGAIALLIMTIMPSSPEGARFDEHPGYPAVPPQGYPTIPPQA